MSCLKPEGAAPGPSGADGKDYNPFDAMQPRVPQEAPVGLRNGGRVKASDIRPTGTYLPNNNILTPHMRSPEYVQLSTAAAMTLGLMPGRMHRCSCTRCLNLLLTYPEGCRANCAYCGLARHREAREDFPDRDDANWRKHTLSWVDEAGRVTLDYRPVHAFTMTNEVKYIEPKARVY